MVVQGLEMQHPRRLGNLYLISFGYIITLGFDLPTVQAIPVSYALFRRALTREPRCTYIKGWEDGEEAAASRKVPERKVMVLTPRNLGQILLIVHCRKGTMNDCDGLGVA